ncbi:MAG TPA: class I SAM-dependent methyltransferase [Sphingomicrobium sp.]|nr:class I SAM-dependent methyltransferase [Sphingomicrobium sp.]
MIHETDLSKLMLQYVQGSEHPDLQVYRRDMVDPASHKLWFWRTKHFCDLGDFYNKRILEVGCGFGWDAVGIAVVGNNAVVASDILPSMVDGMSQCLDAMKAAGTPLTVTPLQGDICKLELPDASFDGIFSTEAIEHVHDLGEMFDNAYRLLTPGGTAVIVNDSNRFNEGSRSHSWGSWGERDDSWEHVEWLKREIRPVEHADAKPFGVMRQEMIRDADSSLDEASVAKLRKATAGMIRPEIEGAVKRFKEDGSLPTPDPFGWSRNPTTGEYSERLLDPFELADMLKARGFKVQLRHLFRKIPYRLFNNIGIRAINKRLFALRPHFILVARKPKRRSAAQWAGP